MARYISSDLATCALDPKNCIFQAPGAVGLQVYSGGGLTGKITVTTAQLPPAAVSAAAPAAPTALPRNFSAGPANMSLASVLGGVATGFATGGIGGAVLGGLGGLFGGPGGQPSGPGVGVSGGFQLPAGTPFGLGGVGGTFGYTLTGPGSTKPAAGGACPKGYHLNKHPLAPSKHHGAVAAHALCVRNRHMHALNDRAINRALRRVKRANKLVRKLHRFAGIRRTVSGGHRPGCGCAVCRRRK